MEVLVKGFKASVLSLLIERVKETLRKLQEATSLDYDAEGDAVDVAGGIAHIYNSSGLAGRIAELEKEVAYLRTVDTSEKKTVSPGAVVTIEYEKEKCTFLILSAEYFSGFETVKVDGVEISTLTTESPLFKALAGKCEGETVKFGTSSIRILRVV